MRKLTILLSALGLAVLSASSALAIPELQLYIEGATYDAGSETWVTESTGSLRLWAVGNVGAKGPILDVKLAIAYASGLTPTFGLTGSTAGGYNGFDDPSAASDPVFSQTQDGTQPLLGDGDPLPAHGIYGAGTAWSEYKLGDFTLEDSYIADFSGATDTPVPGGEKGQINVYDISFSGVPEGSTFHFDLYDHYYNKQENAVYTKAPFSHDGETGGQPGEPVPEPGTLALVGVGVAGLAARVRRRSK